MKSAHLICWTTLFLSAARLTADQIQMENGDHYNGKILSMTADKIVLQSEILGRITVPRVKVENLVMGNVVSLSAPSSASVAPAKTSGAAPEIGDALRHLGVKTNFVEQIRKQFLDGAGPEANAKYNELVSGLLSGKFDMNTLRAQAKSAADQIRSLKSQGNDMGGLLDTYLAILDSFLKESDVSTSAPVTRTNYGTSIIR